MNRTILLAAWAIMLVGGLFMSCADPLDDSSSRHFNPVGPFNDTIHGFDTVLVFDTTVTYDTLIVFDSAGNVDTVVVLDSIFSIDTVVVFDSTFNYDTVVVFDTTVNIDTVVIIDTSSHVDTIVIDPSGSGGFSMVSEPFVSVHLASFGCVSVHFRPEDILLVHHHDSGNGHPIVIKYRIF